jgi:hypothetical protein
MQYPKELVEFVFKSPCYKGVCRRWIPPEAIGPRGFIPLEFVPHFAPPFAPPSMSLKDAEEVRAFPTGVYRWQCWPEDEPVPPGWEVVRRYEWRLEADGKYRCETGEAYRFAYTPLMRSWGPIGKPLWYGQGAGQVGDSGVTLRLTPLGWQYKRQGYMVPLPGGARGWQETPWRYCDEEDVLGPRCPLPPDEVRRLREARHRLYGDDWIFPRYRGEGVW